MGTKLLKFTGLFLLLATLTGCPGGEEECFDMGSTARVDDLIKIFPLQTTYNQGDVITIKSEIPAQNEYFGEPLNLFLKTNDYSARLVNTSVYLFTDNEVTYLKGSIEAYDGGWSNVVYNPETDYYELEIRIKLNKTGNYSFSTGDSFEFQGSTKCNRYRLDTNIEGWNSEGRIEFTVQ
jgi:hypothetical protein